MQDEELDQMQDEGLEDAPEVEEERDDSESSSGGEDEPFFKLNDRQVYRTPEDAQKALRELNETLGRYRQYGDPDTIAKERGELEALRKVREAFNGNSVKNLDGSDDPFKGLDERSRKSWEAATPVIESILKSRGYLTKEEAEKLADQRAQSVYQSATAEQRAYSAAENALRERGLEPTRSRMAALEHAAMGLAQNNKEIAEKYQSGDFEGFASAVLTELYGEHKAQPKQQETGGEDGRVRDRNGRFVRAAYDQAKKKTAGLPKVGSPGGPGVAEGENDRPKTDAERRRMAKEIERAFFAESA